MPGNACMQHFSACPNPLKFQNPSRDLTLNGPVNVQGLLMLCNGFCLQDLTAAVQFRFYPRDEVLNFPLEGDKGSSATMTCHGAEWAKRVRPIGVLPKHLRATQLDPSAVILAWMGRRQALPTCCPGPFHVRTTLPLITHSAFSSG